MTVSKTQLRALKHVGSNPGATTYQIYEASKSRTHPKYPAISLSKRGMIEESEKNPDGWQITKRGQDQIESYRKAGLLN